MMSHPGWSLMTILLVSLRSEIARTTQVNVAYRKPAYQRDTTWGGVPSRAVDGNSNPDFFAGSCTQTNSVSQSWWMVDLLVDYQIKGIDFMNRQYSESRLRDFYVYVSKVNPTPIPAADGSLVGQLCVHEPNIVPDGGPYLYNCTQPVSGRYVYVYKPAHNALTLCEFEVIVGQLKEANYKLIQGKKSSLAVSFSTVVQPVSHWKCLTTCTAALPRGAIHIQLHKTSGSCECVEFDNHQSFQSYTVSNTDYDLYVMS